ncbi:MAG: phosphoribosylaminoimidazolesuccinocarboxamide synthase [Armatimonadota bacterium]
MIVVKTEISGLTKFRTGKVRDVYDLGDELLIVATDRISAYDVVMPNGIPDKGRVLTQLSLFWFDLTQDIVRNHLITADIRDIISKLESCGIANAKEYEQILEGRSMIVRKAEPFPVECIVRGYISGSAWKEYKQLLDNTKDGTVNLHGVVLPSNLVESDKLPQPIFTPSTKEEVGAHDVNISQEEMVQILGAEYAEALIDKSLAIYATAAEYALKHGIIIADTKFEFGKFGKEVILIDEVLTPDSSRFWDIETYKPGGSQPSFDKQYVRDWLDSIGFNREPPAPELPDEVIKRTSEKYREAYRRLVGKELR